MFSLFCAKPTSDMVVPKTSGNFSFVPKKMSKSKTQDWHDQIIQCCIIMVKEVIKGGGFYLNMEYKDDKGAFV